MNIAGDLKDTTKVQQALVALSPLINKYPDYADLYVLRTIYSLILKDSDYVSMNADLDSALKYRQSKKYISSYDSDAPMYLLKAKIDYLSGDIGAELSIIFKRRLTQILLRYSLPTSLVLGIRSPMEMPIRPLPLFLTSIP